MWRRVRGLKGGRPDLEYRFGQSLDDFLETGESLESEATPDRVWKVRTDSLYHARRHFNKTPELYALYKESLAWKAARRAEAAVKDAERSLTWHRRELRKAERTQTEAAHTQRVLLYSLQTLLRAHAGLDPALALVSLTAAITQLGVEGALAVMRQRPDRLGLPPPSRSQRLRQRVAGERAKDSPLVTRLEPEVWAYARAQAKASAGRDITECRRAAQEREKALREARDALQRATHGHGSVSMAERRHALSKEQRAALRAFERSRDPARAVADIGLGL